MKTPKRLYSKRFVPNETTDAVGRDVAIRHYSKEIAQEAAAKIVEDMVDVKGTELFGQEGAMLTLDVYVLTPDEMLEIAERLKIIEGHKGEDAT